MTQSDIEKALEPLWNVAKLLKALQQLDANFPVLGIRVILWLAILESGKRSAPTVRELGDSLTIKNASGEATEKPQGMDRHSTARLVRSLSTGDSKIGVKGGIGLIEAIDDPNDKRVKRVRLTAHGWEFVSEHFGLQPFPKLNKSGLAIGSATAMKESE